MTTLSDILPKYPPLGHRSSCHCGYCQKKNIRKQIVNDCHTALEQALKDGVICFVPSKADVLFCLNDEAKKHISEEITDYHRADAIIQLLKNQKDINV